MAWKAGDNVKLDVEKYVGRTGELDPAAGPCQYGMHKSQGMSALSHFLKDLAPSLGADQASSRMRSSAAQ